MRLTLFQRHGHRLALPLEGVRHVLEGPDCYRLPLTRDCFGGVFLFEDDIVPLLADGPDMASPVQPTACAFVLVVQADSGTLGVPADRIERITSPGEAVTRLGAEDGRIDKHCEISGQVYRLLNLNHRLEAPAIS